MKTVAILLSGAGIFDGSEISESVLTFLSLDEGKIKKKIFAVDIECDVVNHQESKNMLDHPAGKGRRNLLEESARIGGGPVLEISDLNISEFDALIIIGGFGPIKNYSNIFAVLGGNESTISFNEKAKNIVLEFYKGKKPIGGICLAATFIAAVLSKSLGITPEITIGNLSGALKTDNSIIEKTLGFKAQVVDPTSFHSDKANRIFSTNAFLSTTDLAKIRKGIESMIHTMMN